jgi:hypothetical protein
MGDYMKWGFGSINRSVTLGSFLTANRRWEVSDDSKVISITDGGEPSMTRILHRGGPAKEAGRKRGGERTGYSTLDLTETKTKGAIAGSHTIEHRM